MDEPIIEIEALKKFGMVDIEIPQQKTQMILDGKHPQRKWGYAYKNMVMRTTTLIIAYDENRKITDVRPQQYQRIRRELRWKRLERSQSAQQ
jgi:hypothetical protein